MATALYPAARLDPPGYVLMVMDDPFLRGVVRLQVGALGLPVQEGLSVRRAFARIDAAPPAVILLDLWVDHGQGLTLLERWRGRGDGARVPVLLVGDDPRAEVQLGALALGAEGPIPLTEVSRIGPWLERVLEGGGDPADVS